MRLFLLVMVSAVFFGCDSVAPANLTSGYAPTAGDPGVFAEKLQYLARGLGGAGYREEFDSGIRCTREQDAWEVTWSLRYHANPPSASLRIQGRNEREPGAWTSVLANESEWLQESFISQPAADDLHEWISALGPELQAALPRTATARRTIDGWTFELSVEARAPGSGQEVCQATLRWYTASPRR